MIKNKTRKTVVSKKSKQCTSVLSQAMGLRFSKEPRTLVFDLKKMTQAAFDMFFVFFKIDIAFLDEERKVVDLKEGFRPFTAYTPKKPFRYAIEMPVGTIKESKTVLGDRLDF